MGSIESAPQVLAIVAVISRYDEALAWARERWGAHWGPIALQSRSFAFTQTDYYLSTMGPDLRKTFLLSGEPIDPSDLARIKVTTNGWEQELAEAATGRYAEPRPLNLDPGYLTEDKLVLASTKNHSHRLYIGQGIYAEFTLQYRRAGWQICPWTYPDYQEPAYHEFFTECRDYLRQLKRKDANRS